DASQTVHERALQHAPNDAQLHASYAHLLWRQRRTNEAFAAVERALRLAPGHEWAWNLLQEWANDRGEPDRVTTLARSLTLERPGEARVWLVLVGILSNPDDLSERRAAVDRALALEPHSTEAWDAKATLLTEAEQFDDALRACEEGIAACTVDVHLLRGRQAWIEAQRRRLPEAVERMRAVLAENASYAWGWSQLAAWLVVQEAHQEASTALEQLVQLQPYNAWVHRQLGFLRLKQDDLEGARKAFATTLRLTPTDAAAAANLLDLQIREGDDEAATATLRLMQTHQPGARTLAAAITLDLRAGEPKAALRGLRELCTSPDPDPRPINEVTLEFQRIGPARRAVRVLQRALKAGSCNPQVAAALIRLLILRNQRPRATRVFLRLPEGEARHRAVAPLVQGLVAGRSRFRFWWILRRRGRSLARDDESWGHVGYGLITLNRMRAGARWMADWRTRRIVQPWMLFNYCLALRDLGRYDEANAVARHVVDTWGHREGAADLHLFLAVEEALAGAVEPARQHLASAVVRKDVAHDQALSALAGALLEHLQTPREERPAGFSSLRDRL
ncbi:MAG: hypothetical protein KDM81_15445, partial [Verrucomicrobiae bacterium]|nr:hypothetical protein [Verrucomicrobiae bacterium]